MTKPHQGLRLTTAALMLALLLSGCGFFNILDSVTAVAQSTNVSYPIVDTNQELTYGNTSVIQAPGAGARFYGQDAQIDGNQPSYVDNGDGTVTDVVTGLMWQQGYSGKMSQSQAEAGADSFNLAEYTDWRLPSIKELYSLIDFSGEDVDPLSSSANKPFIDTETFDFVYGNTSAGERIIDSQWATTSIYVAGDQMFGVNFADGRIKGYGLTSPRGGDMQFYVRYVRGNTAYGENDFIVSGNGVNAVARAESGETTIPLSGGTITDLATGLMWSQDDSGNFSSSEGTVIASNGGAMDWEDALAYVQDLNDQNYLGYSDWTLPNAKELQSIVDYSRSPDTTNSAAIDPVFNSTSITNEAGQKDWAFYWTGTTHASARGGEAAVYFSFGRSLGYMNGRWTDVHGAGSQRSDPKEGDASDYPTGFGPQGDARRIANYVRVVRDNGSSVSAGALAESDDSSIPLAGDVAAVGDSSDTSFGSGDSPNSNVVAAGHDAIDADSYVLFAPLGGEKAYLISRDGEVVNEWSLSGQPGNSVYLLEGGDLLATYTVRGTFSGGGIGGGVQLLTWDGVEVWSFELATDHAHLHHDVEMLPNGHVLMISWESKTQAEALAAGLSANHLPESGEVWSEMILEYDPTLDKVVWEWHLWDHALPTGWEAVDHPEKIDLDYASNRHSSDWWHLNSVDYSDEFDQIVISSRNVSEIWIIDHDLTTAEAAGEAGDLLYRYGNPEAYGASGIQGLLHQHDAEFITEELLADGNSSGTAASVRILVFDNGDPKLRPYSRVLELDLPNYQDATSSSARVLPASIVWQYPSEEAGTSVASGGFFADHISGSQRLESGNTLICSGIEGRFFEVTPEGETVWEYVNPFTSTLPNGKTSNEVFRAEAYSADFIGQALGDASSVAQDVPQNIGVGEQSPSEPGATQPLAGGVPGISSISPVSVRAGAGSQLVTIMLDDRFDPPAQVQFTDISIGDIEAVSWTRAGLTVRAWFDIPASVSPGDYNLIITFPGRNNEIIQFSSMIHIS